MKRNACYYAIALTCAGVAVTAFVLITRGHSVGAGHVEAIQGILVEPGTEILFELSRPVDPRPISISERHKVPGVGDVEIIPPTPPADGKYPGGGGRWHGFGLVWASDTQLLYVAPDQASSMFDELRLEPAVRPESHTEKMSLAIHLLGAENEHLLRCVGFRELAEVRSGWLGKGDVRLKVVAVRSREEAGKDRPLPPRAFDLVTPDEYENGKLVKRGGRPLYIHPGKPVEAFDQGRREGPSLDKASKVKVEKR